MSNKKLCLIGASSDLGLAIAKTATELAGIEVYGISRKDVKENYKKTQCVSTFYMKSATNALLFQHVRKV